MYIVAGSTERGAAKVIDLTGRHAPAPGPGQEIADASRSALRARGMTDRKIDRLAARFAAEGRTGSVDDFIEWAD